MKVMTFTTVLRITKMTKFIATTDKETENEEFF